MGGATRGTMGAREAGNGREEKIGISEAGPWRLRWAARYLTQEKRAGGDAFDPVAHFHLSKVRGMLKGRGP